MVSNHEKIGITLISCVEIFFLSIPFKHNDIFCFYDFIIMDLHDTCANEKNFKHIDFIIIWKRAAFLCSQYYIFIICNCFFSYIEYLFNRLIELKCNILSKRSLKDWKFICFWTATRP